MSSDPEFREQYEAWQRSRDDFNARLGRRDPETVREAWQRYYFTGEVPEDLGQAPANHVNKRRLKPVRLGR